MLDKSKIKMGSNRSLGIVFFLVFLIIGLWPLLNDGQVRIWSFIISIIFLFLGVINSKFSPVLFVSKINMGIINPILNVSKKTPVSNRKNR